MIQITDLEELVGKTVAKAIDFDEERLGLIFTDDTYLYIRPRSGYDGDASLEWDEMPDDDEHKVALGLMTREEYDRLKAEQKIHNEALRQQHERREYERLKAKFEGGLV